MRVLIDILIHLGYHKWFILLIKWCIFLSKFKVHINGSPHVMERSLRQGDPMPPTIFTISSNLLSQLLDKLNETSRLMGLRSEEQS